MQHDPGLIVKDFIVEAAEQNEIFGCFFHHDFSKHPIGHDDIFLINNINVKSKWIDGSQQNSAVIDAYDSIVENEVEIVVSIGGLAEADFVRAAIETSGKELIWAHILTISNHMHDSRFAETMLSIDHILTYSESQKENIILLCGVNERNISVIDRYFKRVTTSNVSKIDIICGGWNTEVFNFKSIFEAVSGLDVSFRCLTNYYEYGDFDLDIMSSMYFQGSQIYPLEFASLFDKPIESEWDNYIENARIYVDMSMSQGGCSTLLRALHSGAVCVIIDTPRHRELYHKYRNVILVKACTFFSSSGLKLYIPDSSDLNLIISDILQDRIIKHSNLVICNECKEKSEKEFIDLLNSISHKVHSGRHIDIESIT